MCEAVTAAVAGRVPVIPMVAAATVEDSIELAKHAAAHKAAAVSAGTERGRIRKIKIKLPR